MVDDDRYELSHHKDAISILQRDMNNNYKELNQLIDAIRSRLDNID